MTFIGRWVMIDDEEYYHLGEVVDTLDGHLLIRGLMPEHVTEPESCRLYALQYLSGRAFFFDSREKLEEWVAWLVIPDEKSANLKVVSGVFRKPDKSQWGSANV